MKLNEYIEQANELLKAVRKDDPTARQRMRKFLPMLHYYSPIQARFVIARENGYTGWPALRAACNKEKSR